MLYTSEIQRLNAMPEYKKATGVLSNLSYVKGCYKRGATVDVKFALSNKATVSIGIPFKLILQLFKPIIIAREMSIMKKQVADRAFNEFLKDYSLRSIICCRDFVWLDLSLSKLDFMKDFLLQFFSEKMVVDCVFEACEHLDDKKHKKKKYNEVVDTLEKKIDDEIEQCKKRMIVDNTLKVYGYAEVYKKIFENGKSGKLTESEE